MSEIQPCSYGGCFATNLERSNTDANLTGKIINLKQLNTNSIFHLNVVKVIPLSFQMN